jgi:hypothetical protein
MRDLTGLVLWTLCGLIGVPAAKRKMATKTDGKPPFALACRAASIISPANTFTVPSPSRDRLTLAVANPMLSLWWRNSVRGSFLSRR